MQRTVEKLDVNQSEHAGFVYDLAMACQDELLDDYQDDIILLISQMERDLKAGNIIGFLCRVDGEKCGLIWVQKAPRDIGELHAAMLPKFRKSMAGHAMYFLKTFIPFCFDRLKLRKLRAMIPVYLKRPERLLRRYGFQKAGLHREETMKDGRPESVVELYLLRNQYKGLQYGKIKKQQLQTARTA